MQERAQAAPGCSPPPRAAPGVSPRRRKSGDDTDRIDGRLGLARRRRGSNRRLGFGVPGGAGEAAPLNRPRGLPGVRARGARGGVARTPSWTRPRLGCDVGSGAGKTMTGGSRPSASAGRRCVAGSAGPPVGGPEAGWAVERAAGSWAETPRAMVVSGCEGKTG
jgi:hypothetical protein